MGVNKNTYLNRAAGTRINQLNMFKTGLNLTH